MLGDLRILCYNIHRCIHYQCLPLVDVLHVRGRHQVCLGGRHPLHPPPSLRHLRSVHHRRLRSILAAEAPYLDDLR